MLKKALERGIKPMLVVNKIDRPTARPDYVVDKVFDLFCDLGATDEQTDFDICYTSAMKGMSGPTPDTVVDGLVRELAEAPRVHVCVWVVFVCWLACMRVERACGRAPPS